MPHREMVFLDWPDAVELAEAHGERYRAFIYLAVDSGMCWSELVGLRRAKLDLRTRKVRVTEQLVRLQTGEWLAIAEGAHPKAIQTRMGHSSIRVTLDR